MPPYLNNLLKYQDPVHPTCAQCSPLLEIPRIKTILWKSAFSFPAPYKWNNLQNTLGLGTLISFSMIVSIIETPVECECFT